jgi:hypothetical protein
VANQVPDTGFPIGTVLVYNAQIDQSLWSLVKTGIGSPDALFQKIGDTLWMKWDLQIVKSDYSSLATVVFGGATPIAITVQMMGPKTYGQADDIRGIIDGEISDALGGTYTTGSNISSWTIPKSAGGTGASVDTGAPAATTSPVSAVLAGVGVDPAAIGDSISNAVKNATSSLGVGSGILLLVLGLAVIAAILIAVAPTAPARAIAAARRRS